MAKKTSKTVPDMPSVASENATKKVTKKVAKTVETQAPAVVNSEKTAVSNALAIMFSDIDFSTLNKTIEALGSQSKALDKEEKKTALEVLNNWNKDVIGRLQRKSYDMQHLLIFFTNKITCVDPLNYNTGFSVSQLEQMVEALNLGDLYKAVLDTRNAATDLDLEKPDTLYIDASMSSIEQIELRNEHSTKMAKYDLEVTKVTRKCIVAWNELIIALKKTEEVKELIAKAQTYIRNVNSMISDCNSKADLAKLNIQIGSKEVRSSLKDLLDFAVRV